MPQKREIHTSDSEMVRVRFAPSPTGDLHVGGVRTALFNWLYARHTGGTFLLRIEDTDLKRSTPEAIQVILDGMKWLGMESDEDVVYQSQRIERHQQAAKKMLESGAAYRCFCDPATLAERREKERQAGQNLPKDRCCANLSPEEIQAKIDAGEKFAVRLLIPDEMITVDDGVHGEVNVNGSEIDDFIILRSDGTPTYMLAVVVDDADMGVTHIIRGDDHLSNTPKQILLYRALGLTPPKFAHVPTILGSDKKKLSKRHGATSITEYRDMGYLPETMVNYLGLLGWSPGDDRDVISRDELIEMFDISGINKSSAVFDDKKLNWLNGQYIGKLSYDDVKDKLAKLAIEAVEATTIDNAPSEAQIHTAWDLFCNRIHLLPELFVWGDYIFQAPKDFDAKGVRKQFKNEGATDLLKEVARVFAGLDNFDAEAIETAIRELAEAKQINGGKLIHPIRLAVSGVTGGPGLFELLAALGRDTVVSRIETAVKLILEDKIPVKK